MDTILRYNYILLSYCHQVEKMLKIYFYFANVHDMIHDYTYYSIYLEILYGISLQYDFGGRFMCLSAVAIY